MISFRDKVILAPMVRTGCLPLRLIALKHGADLVFSPEVIDKGILKTERIINEITGTIEYVTPEGVSVFTTRPDERDRLIFQMGTSDPERAKAVQNLVYEDVAGFDVNCGCPKPFSIKGGMGAALLEKPELLKNILTGLVSNSRGKPVTCKIRVLPTMHETLQLVKMIESTGVSAITVHCRTPKQRPQDPGNWNVFQEIAASLTSIPLIANGDIFSLEDAENVKALSGASSVMIARAAWYNPSIFRKEGPLPINQVGRELLLEAMNTDTPYQLFKYTILPMFPHSKFPLIRQKLSQSRSYKEACDCFEMENDYESLYRKRTLQYQSTSVAKSLSKSRIALFSSHQKKVTVDDLFVVPFQVKASEDHFCPYLPSDIYFTPKQ